MSDSLDPTPQPASTPHHLSPATEKSRHNPTNPDIPHDRNSLGETPDAPAAAPEPPPSIFHPPSSTSPLSPRQLAAVPLLALGKSINTVARELGLHRSTISTWLHNDPAFAAELSNHRENIYGPAATRLLHDANEALETLRHHLSAPDPIIAHRAARTLLALAKLGEHCAPKP